MTAQILSIIIFVGMFLMIILDKFERHMVTLVSGALVLLVFLLVSLLALAVYLIRKKRSKEEQEKE